jgi:hypothetical protein
MKFILRFWKKLLYFLITGSTSIFIAACYGMPAGFANLGQWTIKARNQSNQPIIGLEVTTLEFTVGSAIPDTQEVQRTDSSGSCSTWLTTYDRNANHRFGRSWVKETACGSCDHLKNCQGSSIHLWRGSMVKPDFCYADCF